MGNPYNILHQHSGKLYAVMQDGIQKFGKELNDVFTRTLTETSNIVNVPWALKEIEGGSLKAKKLVDHIIATIISIHSLPPHGDGFLKFCHWWHRKLKTHEYFKASKLLFHDEEIKILALEMVDWPIVIMLAEKFLYFMIKSCTII